MKTPKELAEEWIETNGWNTEPFRDEYTIEFQKQGYVAGYQAGRSNSEAVQAAAPQWISVKDRLPPPEVKVLWWNETADQAGVSSYKYMSHCNDTMIEWGDAGYLSIKNFTHWMPLPEPPEEV
jgi:hypothetical protein